MELRNPQDTCDSHVRNRSNHPLSRRRRKSPQVLELCMALVLTIAVVVDAELPSPWMKDVTSVFYRRGGASTAVKPFKKQTRRGNTSAGRILSHTLRKAADLEEGQQEEGHVVLASVSTRVKEPTSSTPRGRKLSNTLRKFTVKDNVASPTRQYPQEGTKEPDDLQQQQQQQSPTHEYEHKLYSSIRHQELETEIAALADAFKPVIRGRGLLREIDMKRLLSACKKLEATMRKIGQGSSAKDLKNNILKVETLCKIAPPHHRETLSSLLEFEKSLGIHTKPHELKDPSGAIGLLWIQRSLSFQYRMYQQLIDTDQTPGEAAMIAYNKELRAFHGWTLQRLYGMALKTQVPEKRSEMFAKMGGFAMENFGEPEEKATKRDMQELLDVWRPIILRWRETFNEVGLEDTRRV